MKKNYRFLWAYIHTYLYIDADNNMEQDDDDKHTLVFLLFFLVFFCLSCSSTPIAVSLQCIDSNFCWILFVNTFFITS